MGYLTPGHRFVGESLMIEPGRSPAVTPESAAFHVIRDNPDATARDLIARLGATALGLAVDREIKARATENAAATSFWGRVCFAVVRLRLTDGRSPARREGNTGDTQC